MDVPIPPGTFDEESDPRVVRIAQRVEIPMPEAQVAKVARKELSSRAPERIVLGIELASRLDDEKMQAAAKKRLGQILENINTAVLVTIGDRLQELLGIEQRLITLSSWEQYIKVYGKGLEFPEFKPMHDKIRAHASPPIAALGTEKFMEVIDYLDNLNQQELELMVAIDGTGSMGGVIAQAQGQTNRLMITLNDLAKSMEMGVIIFRTHGDRPMLETLPLQKNIAKVRGFLFKVEAKGGGALPEAIYEAMGAVYGIGWSRDATRQMIIIADEPTQPQTHDDLRERAGELRDNGVPVHTVSAGAGAQAKKSMQDLAEWGGGQNVELSETDDLAMVVIRLLTQPQLHPSFEHLYELYIEMGM